MPGTYVENIDLGSKNLTISSESGPDVTVIDGGAAGSVVTIAGEQIDTCVIDGLTITNGDNSESRGGGIFIDASSPTIRNCIIDGNIAKWGGGIYMRNYSSPTIVSNTISNNESKSNGAGIVCYDSSPIIQSNRIIGNSAETGKVGGGLNCYHSYEESSSPLIIGNLILNNDAYKGGGIRAHGTNTNATIINNIIAENVAYEEYDGGAGIYIQSSATITNNTIVGNSAPRYGAGINFAMEAADIVHVNNNIIANSPDGYGVSCTNPVDSFDHNNVWNNADGDYWGSCSPGPSDISEDPLFVDPEGGDYHLQCGSPCIDAGDSTAPEIPDTDYDGEDRIIGEAVDIGADERSLSVVNGMIKASSGGTGMPSWEHGLSIYEDIIHITNTSSSLIHLPLYTILSELEPESVTADNTDGGGDRPPTAYWEWSLDLHDGFDPSDGDAILDPGEKISRKWQFSVPDKEPFTFQADVLGCPSEMKRTSECDFSFSYETPRRSLREPTSGAEDLRFILDDGSAEIYMGADMSGIVLANAFTLDRAVEILEVSFLTSGVSEGDPVDVIIYFDPTGVSALPAPEDEVHRETVALEGGGFQVVDIGAIPMVPGPGGSSRFYVGIMGRSERRCSLGIDLSLPGSGASVSMDGGLSFEPLADHPIVDGSVMIRAEAAEWLGPLGCESGGAASGNRSANQGGAWRLLILAAALCLTALGKAIPLRGGK